MERAEWLEQMRRQVEILYDRLSPQYWVTFGFYENQTHLIFLKKFLELAPPGGPLLSAGCGAGRYDGLLLEAGHPVTGIDQSTGMLERARQRFPQVCYQKMGLQEMDFHQAFDGVTCIDAMEHVSPEDYAGILCNFQQSLKAGGVLYFTMESADPEQLEQAHQRALAKGLPVVFGEVVDRMDDCLAQVQSPEGAPVPGEIADPAVYHFYPSLDQARKWIEGAGLSLVEEGDGSGYHHFLARKM